MTDFILAKVDAARQLLAQARDAVDAKKVADLAHAAEVYAKRQKMGEEAVAYAHAIVIEAERLLGEFLRQAQLNQGGRPKTSPQEEPVFVEKSPTLHEIGVTKKESSNAQVLAEIAEQAPALYEEVRSNTKTVQRARQEYQRQQRHEEKRTVTLAEARLGRFPVLYADPPWQYRNSGLGGAAEQHYPTLPTDQLAALPVAAHSTTNAVLFLWVTNPLLEDALAVVRAWGFQYKTNFCWIKDRSTYGKLGFYNYGRHELLLIATRGSALPKDGTLADSVIESAKADHSRKPDAVYALIERMYDGPYLELFARSARPGWAVFSNEPELQHGHGQRQQNTPV